MDFINILKNHADYVIISGYISIILGRARATEDIDLFIKKIDKNKFLKLYEDLIENGYSVNEVQALLGHKSPETTMIYVHLATPNMIKIKSPIDSL